jgi:hypothetical protein
MACESSSLCRGLEWGWDEEEGGLRLTLPLPLPLPLMLMLMLCRYAAELSFSESLAADWAVRAEDPWSANLFFVPLVRTSATATIPNQHVQVRRMRSRGSGAGFMSQG